MLLQEAEDGKIDLADIDLPPNGFDNVVFKEIVRLIEDGYVFIICQEKEAKHFETFLGDVAVFVVGPKRSLAEMNEALNQIKKG